MILTVLSVNKQLDLYEVGSDTGEKQMVTSNQILSVMIKGHKFSNANLTKKGFSVQTSKGTRYIQVEMSKQTRSALLSKIEHDKCLAEQNVRKPVQQKVKQPVQQPVQKAVQQPVKIQNTPVKSSNSPVKQKKNPIQQDEKINIHRKIDGNREKFRCVYMGEVFTSPESICKKYNADINTFIERMKQGYSVAESLGLRRLRPIDEVQLQRKSVSSALNTMAKNRGEY